MKTKKILNQFKEMERRKRGFSGKSCAVISIFKYQILKFKVT